MKETLQLVYVITLYITQLCHYVLATETRVVTTAPVSPVVEGEILSVHCQVWSLQKGQDVSLFRTSADGVASRIAVIVDGDALIASNTGTVFVAVRQMHDGSVVHFLSILGAAKEDAGKYSCKTETVADTDAKLPIDSVDINIAYFPSDPDPKCSPNELPSPIQAGEEISLSCSSEVAYPEVTLQWTRSGSSKVFNSETTTDNGRTESHLKLQIGSGDNGKVFTCQMKSKFFPERTKNCHIGPITVESNGEEPDINEEDRYVVTPPPFSLGNLPPFEQESNNDQIEDTDAVDKQQCLKSCSTENSSVMYWILATATASLLAFLFLILGVIMIVKYYRVPSQGHIPKTQYIPALHAGEEIYVEVESKRRDKSMYMSLEKPRKPAHMNFPTAMTPGEM